MEHKAHRIKLQKKYCDDVYLGNKNFELRYNDRDYKVGDTVTFIPMDNDKMFSHKISEKSYIITYVLNADDYCDLENWVIFGIKEN